MNNKKVIVVLIGLIQLLNGLQQRAISRRMHAQTYQLAATVDVAKTVTEAKFTPALSHSYKDLKYNPVVSFGVGHESELKIFSNEKEIRNILGGKGANLGKMSALGLSVPPGFTLTTEVCAAYQTNDKKLSEEVWKSVLAAMSQLEKSVGRKFGDADAPLLVSVRSGAAISMPGMLDTVLNLGVNDNTVKGLSKQFGERFALDSYRRFLNMFGDVVMGIPHHHFENELKAIKLAAGVEEDSQLPAEKLKILVEKYKAVYEQHGKTFPQDPVEQLYESICAVFSSWGSDRAVMYRSAEGITGLLGTAVNVQAMVFGNMGPTSGTGVCFTRNPNTGEHLLYGEYLINAQGEDVVAGIRTPEPISTLKDALPEAYAELMRNVNILEAYYHDMQDIEFTIQEGKLYMLQTRSGKRAGQAAINIALDMLQEKLATVEQAIMMVKPEHIKQLLHPQFASVDSDDYKKAVVASGLAASPGAAVGKIVFSPEAAEASYAIGEPCILVREDTSPEDVGGMWASEGILTATGGYTSHASVVARGWGKPCVCGCGDLHIDYETQTAILFRKDGKSKKPVTLRAGDWISINGDNGEILVGKQILSPPNFKGSKSISSFMDLVDKTKKMRVLANADTPHDAEEARRNGAEGIGLTRTEHMFFAEDRINVVRRMILAKDQASRQQALDELLVYQRKDFQGILEAMDGLPVTVRLLDPPLHEFLPRLHSDDKVSLSATEMAADEAFAASMDMTIQEVQFAIQRLQEVNPMLGLRGCRLGIVIPELVEMQTRALAEAAIHNQCARGLCPRAEIMVPLIGSAAEFSHQAKLIRDTVKKVEQEFRQKEGGDVMCGANQLDIKVGTMIEVPRAALTAAEIVKAGAEFFSYGTNDLTQMTFGFSRDDSGSFLPQYLRDGILQRDPFHTIDEEAVGLLVVQSAKAGKAMANEMSNTHTFKAGVCGEHGGDPHSVRYFARNGLDYVSCSPFRVPLARLAAAQAVAQDLV
eukprot:CAMPEP_0170057456 /NCGR_PEP_ID=MMETSP0019_2-20121128/454_1 /TAXON_ID=98059 /ORGANISM="Dinobryon sp., Strain UTEXLB2267" /LENGTH=986 /DNA_ID=CAMNT_0010262165 /DNA_START=33 /DNA_END=2993 /DNA_ORIENTATION=+